LACRKCRLYDAHDATSHLQRKKVGRDGKHNRANHASEDARNDAAEQQKRIRGRHCAQKGAQYESDVEEEQEVLAVEAIRETRSQNRGDAGAEGVGRYHQPEL
jgi:hypothetical protein